MATNKNAFIRYKILDECFSNPYRKYFIDDLIKVCSEKLSDYVGQITTVSRRQLIDDMNFMKSSAGYEAPIETYREQRKGYYRYSDLDFSILKKPLTIHEVDELKQALLVLGRMKNMDRFGWVEDLQTKLQYGLDEEKGIPQVIDFEDNINLKGLEYLGELYKLINLKHVVSINYMPFNFENSVNYIISPYYLKQYNGRWFLLGWNYEEEYLQTIALDRIVSIEVDQKNLFIENKVDFFEYFDDIIGVTNYLDQHLQSVVIKLSPQVVPYIKTKPVHESQVVTSDNILKLKVKLNYELETLILSFGEKMTVIEPIELRDKILKRIHDSFNQYNL